MCRRAGRFPLHLNIRVEEENLGFTPAVAGGRAAEFAEPDDRLQGVAEPTQQRQGRTGHIGAGRRSDWKRVNQCSVLRDGPRLSHI